MADYSEGGVECKSSNIVELRKQVLSLVTRKFEGTIEKPIDDVVSGVLLKRRKKWRRRHHLSSEGEKLNIPTKSLVSGHYVPLICMAVTSRPPDPALRDEKEQLTDQYYQSGERLLVCRRSSYALARELEREKRKLQLQAAVCSSMLLETHCHYMFFHIGEISQGNTSTTISGVKKQ